MYWETNFWGRIAPAGESSNVPHRPSAADRAEMAGRARQGYKEAGPGAGGKRRDLEPHAQTDKRGKGLSGQESWRAAQPFDVRRGGRGLAERPPGPRSHFVGVQIDLQAMHAVQPGLAVEVRNASAVVAIVGWSGSGL